MPQRCFAREAEALAFLNGNFTGDEDEDAGVEADARRAGGGRGDNQVTWGEDARQTGGSTASPGPVRLRLSQLSWLSSSLSSLSSALSDTDQGDARRSHRAEADEGGARRPRRARRAGAGAWLCCCCGGGGADARDEVGVWARVRVRIRSTLTSNL